MAPKFIQIALSPMSEQEFPMLLGLDEAGCVWNFVPNHEVWIPLQMTRGHIVDGNAKPVDELGADRGR